jgi:hypothetical protein
MRAAAPLLLLINGGYVDTAGFLALQGLLTAHVTGNFVTAGASLVFGTTGDGGKLLALPVFALIIALARILGAAMAARPGLRRVVLLTPQLVLLLTSGVLAIRFGPFANGDTTPAIVAGMMLVSGMAIQSAVDRVHLAAFPPSTLMTGDTTRDRCRGSRAAPYGCRSHGAAHASGPHGGNGGLLHQRVRSGGTCILAGRTVVFRAATGAGAGGAGAGARIHHGRLNSRFAVRRVPPRSFVASPRVPARSGVSGVHSNRRPDPG